MSEVDNQEIDTEFEEVDTTDIDTDIDTDPDEISYEDALKWKKDSERLEKAEKLVVDQKRRLKELEKSKQESGDYVTKEELAMEKFIDKNPDLEWYRDEITKYTKKGNTLEEAKILVLSKDKSVENRKILSQSKVSDWESPTTKVYTREALEKMSDSARKQAILKIDRGEASFG